MTAEIHDTTISNDLDLIKIGNDLNDYGAQLAGVEDILNSEVNGDAHYVAAIVCRQINHQLCMLGDQLAKLGREGGVQ